MDGLFTGWLAKMPVILDSSIHQLVNTISTSIQVMMSSQEVVGSSNSKIFIYPNQTDLHASRKRLKVGKNKVYESEGVMM